MSNRAVILSPSGILLFTPTTPFSLFFPRADTTSVVVAGFGTSSTTRIGLTASATCLYSFAVISSAFSLFAKSIRVVFLPFSLFLNSSEVALAFRQSAIDASVKPAAVIVSTVSSTSGLALALKAIGESSSSLAFSGGTTTTASLPSPFTVRPFIKAGFDFAIEAFISMPRGGNSSLIL